jgi:mono/diheme cytochrome c family protein
LTSTLSGCAKSPPPQFHSNLVQMAKNNIAPKHQQEIADILEAMYGTPDDPFVLPETGLDLQKVQMAAGSVKSVRTGAKLGLFREHCVHCHGITGDSLGPTAVFLKPYPRDYRQGLYKFKSTPSNTPPTHEDLVRTLKEGIMGTAMPSFKLLPQAEIEALVEYVKYLSLRGQTELKLIDHAANELSEADDFPKTRDFLVGEMLTPIVGKWQGAAAQVTQVPNPPTDFGSAASIERGKTVFYSTGGCVKCHGPTALGDGQVVYDLWNEPIAQESKKLIERERKLREDTTLSSEARAAEAKQLDALSYALHVAALPPREGQPRNLRQGIYHGGRQPYELFYRLANGIFPAQMPGIAQTPNMTTDDIWHVIDFVLDLPYQPGSQYYTEQHMAAPPRERL